MAESLSLWGPLLDDSTFKQEVSELGYSRERSFVGYLKKHGLDVKLKKSGAITAPNLSIDFFARQSRELTKLGFYVIRTGKGKFMVFKEDVFPRPYLDLKTKDSTDFDPKAPAGFEQLAKCFVDNSLENSALEQLRFMGFFDSLVKQVTKQSEYFVGPRGNRVSDFDVYMKKKTGELVRAFHFNGQEELDYSLFTKNAVFLIEAKNMKGEGGFDVGWHKIAFPAYRLSQMADTRIIPCYFLRKPKASYFFVFPDFKFNEKGVVLNDEKDFTPRLTFRISS